jgi:hypothetical protein
MMIRDRSAPIEQATEIEVTPEVLASCVSLASDWISENRDWIEAGGLGDLDDLVLRLAKVLHQRPASR